MRAWHRYITAEATTVPRKTLLLVPCAKEKPYLPPTRSFFYNWLWKFLNKQKLRDNVFVCTVSEPFGLFPETDYSRMPCYELSPALLKQTPDLFDLYAEKLAVPIAMFLKRNFRNHQHIVAYVRSDSTHATFLDKANELLRDHMIQFPVTQEDFDELRRTHPRMWHLNWMIFLQEKLGTALRL